MSARYVDVVVTLNIDLGLAEGRPVVGVNPTAVHTLVTEAEVEQAVELVVTELAPLLADVTGELDELDEAIGADANTGGGEVPA